jgi:hypothetical protein
MSLNLLTRQEKGTALDIIDHDNNLTDTQNFVNSLESSLNGHIGGSDPHTQYQKETEKGAANGYAALDSNGRVPLAQLGSGTPSATKFLRGDGAWITVEGVGAGELDFTGLGLTRSTAIGDGVTDDGPTILAELNALAAAGGGALLLQPYKTYLVSTITLTAKVKLLIWGGFAGADNQGNAKLKLKPYNGATSASTRQCPLVLDSCSKIRIMGVDLDGSRGEHTGFVGTSGTHAQYGNGSMNALSLISSREVRCERVGMLNSNTDGLFIAGKRTWTPYTLGDYSPASQLLSFIDCVIDRNGRNGMSPITIRNSEWIRTTFNDNGDLAVQPDGPGAGIDFEADKGEADANNGGTFNQPERCYFEDCTWSRNGSTGFILSNRRGNKASGIIIRNFHSWGNGRFQSASFNALDIQIYGTPETAGTLVSSESFGVWIDGGEARSQGIYIGTFSSTVSQETFNAVVQNVQMGPRAEIICRFGRGNVQIIGNRWDRVRVVMSSVTTAPPAGQAHGATFIIPPGATGVWAGADKEKKYAIYDEDNALWGYSPPTDGDVVYCLDTGSGVNDFLVFHERPAGAHGSAAGSGWEIFSAFVSTADAIKIDDWWSGRILIERNEVVSTGLNNSGLYAKSAALCATDLWIEKNKFSNTTKRLLGTAEATGDSGARGARLDGGYRYVDLRFNWFNNCSTGIDLTGTDYTRLTLEENTYEDNTANSTVAAGMPIVVRRGERVINGTMDSDLPAPS